jgi:EmrB/QacA subfamily drug resistance transporter
VTVHPRRKTATVGILLGLLLSALDSTLVATALPVILEKLDGFTLYFLPNAVFMVVQTSSMPIWGRMSDLYGRRSFHLAAVVILLAGSVLCARSGSLPFFVASRAVQGLGAGGLMSLSFTMIADLYELEDRAKMQGAISSVWGIAALAGPLLGGWITHAWDWTGIFWLNLPIGIASAIVVQAVWERKAPEGKARPDLAGALLLLLAAGAALAGCSVASRSGWTHPAALGSFAAVAVLVLALAAVERRREDPFIAYDLFRIRLFATGAFTGVCAMICMFDAIQHIPFLVVGILRRTPTTGGLMLTCMMVPWMACSGATRALLARFSYRALAATGMLLAGAAYALLDRVGVGSSLVPVIGAMGLLGAGLGLTVAPLLIAAQNAVPKSRLGAATSLTQFTRSMGAFAGLALVATMFLAPFGGREPQGLIDYRMHHDPEQLRAIVAPLREGLGHAFHGGLGAAALGLVLALLIPAGKAAELKAAAEPARG